jgi:hypothetical protein
MNILTTPWDKFPEPPPPPPPPSEWTSLKVYQTLREVYAAGLGKWAEPCDGPFELSVRIQRNHVILYKLRCLCCRRGGGAIAHDSIPLDLRVRTGEEVPEPSQFANVEWYDRPENR